MSTADRRHAVCEALQLMHTELTELIAATDDMQDPWVSVPLKIARDEIERSWRMSWRHYEELIGPQR